MKDVNIIEIIGNYFFDLGKAEKELNEFKNIESIKPKNFNTLKDLGIIDSESRSYIENIKSSSDSKKEYNSKKQFVDFLKNLGYDIIANSNMYKFVDTFAFRGANSHYSSRKSKKYPFKIRNVVDTNIILNDNIINDLKEFKKISHNEHLHIEYSYDEYLNINISNKKDVEKMSKNRRKRGQNKIKIEKTNFHILYKDIDDYNFQKLTEIVISNSDKPTKEYIILYPMKKYGEKFWIVVTDSSSLVKVKRFDEYVEDKKDKLQIEEVATSTLSENNSKLVKDVKEIDREIPKKNNRIKVIKTYPKDVSFIKKVKNLLKINK